jgi:hypothetical protein
VVLPAVRSKDKAKVITGELIIRDVSEEGIQSRVRGCMCIVSAGGRCSLRARLSLPGPWEQDGSRHSTASN